MKLIGRTEPVVGREFSVGDVLRVGAAATNDARISAMGVSRNHARLWREGKWFWIEDAGSTNGTFLNGQRIQRDRLHHLDVVTLGRNVDLIFICRAGEQPEPASVGILSASLTLVDGPDAGTSIDLPKGEMTIGRSPSCELVVESSIVSKVHARIRRTLELVTIQDLGSANGTFVNDQRLTTPTVLTDGDRINLAGVRALTIRIARDPAAAPAKTPQQPITGPIPVFDQEWKTRLVWSPEEIAEIEAFRAKVAPVREAEGEKAQAAAKAKPPAAAAAKAPAARPPASPVKAEGAAPAENPAAAARPAADRPAAPAKAAPAAAPPAPKASARPEDAAAKAPAVVPKPPAEAAAAPAKAASPPPAPSAKPVSPPAAAPAPPSPPAPLSPGAPVKEVKPSSAPAAAGAPLRDKAVSKPPERRAPATEDETIPIAIAPPPIRNVRLTGEAGTFALEQGTFVVGRALTATVRLDNRELSRNHATIVVTPTAVTIEDQGSANGTFVNDVESKGRQPLRDGDRVAFGSVAFNVELVR